MTFKPIGNPKADATKSTYGVKTEFRFVYNVYLIGKKKT